MNLEVKVTVTNRDGTVYRQFVMNHDDANERRVLGTQCRNAFEAGQTINTSPIVPKVKK